MPSSHRPTVLVVGGAGFIGSQVNRQLHASGYNTVVFDNLSRGHSQAVTRGQLVVADLSDPAALDAVMSEHHFDAVLHFAAFTDVGASVSQPAHYYRNNVTGSLHLLEAMVRHKIDKIIFSSSAAIFGLPQTPTIAEEHPCSPLSPYGHSKLMVEQLLHDFQNAYGVTFCSLRYFNAAGGDPSGEVKSYQRPEHNLIPRLLRAIHDKKPTATLFGNDYPTRDGTCIRDYIHIWDLGNAHIAALEHLLNDKPSACYNLGNGQGFTVKEVISSIEKITATSLQLNIAPRRVGDPPVLVANGHKAFQELSWQPHYSSLDTIVEHAWLSLN